MYLWIIVRKKKSDKLFEKNETHFMLDDSYRKELVLCDNVQKYYRSGRDVYNNMVLAQYVLDA